MAVASIPRKTSRTAVKLAPSPELAAELHFDRYVASARSATMEKLAELFVECGERLKLAEKKSRRGTVFGYHYYDERGKKVGSVYLKDRIPTVEVMGNATPVVVERLRAKYEHFVWKVDVCLDSHGGELEYDTIKNAFYAVQDADSRLQVDSRGDPKHPERGFRCYLGMKDSPGSACVYQKGLQPGFRRFKLPDWNRVEWRLNVAIEHRQLASTLDPLNTLRLNATTSKLANKILGLTLKPFGKLPKPEKKCIRTLEYVCDKFSRSFREAGRELGGTDIVLAKIGFAIDRQRWICHPETIYVTNRTGGTDVRGLLERLKDMAKRQPHQWNIERSNKLPAVSFLVPCEDVESSTTYLVEV
jgi:hypothetical protein